MFLCDVILKKLGAPKDFTHSGAEVGGVVLGMLPGSLLHSVDGVLQGILSANWCKVKPEFKYLLLTGRESFTRQVDYPMRVSFWAQLYALSLLPIHE